MPCPRTFAISGRHLGLYLLIQLCLSVGISSPFPSRPQSSPSARLFPAITITMSFFKKPVHLIMVLVFILCVFIYRHFPNSKLLRYHIQTGGHKQELSQRPTKGVNTLSIPFRSRVGDSSRSGSTYSRVLVIPCLNKMETDWAKSDLSDVELAAYVVNNTNAIWHSPRNKGHEVTVYLSYIIDHYANLPDIVIFMHAHRWAHHNEKVLDHDAVQMVKRLSSQHVARQGYVNLRCNWYPGCPEWLHPNNKQDTLARQEEMMISKSWAELFPLDALPTFLAQTCCAQFALSKGRISSIPLSRFIYYRDWILTTPLTDYISGRIWEYSWQFLFMGNASYCPREHHCYCETYGICFDGERPYEDFKQLYHQKKILESQRENPVETTGPSPQFEATSDVPAATSKPSSLVDQIQALDKKLAESKLVALRRGDELRHEGKVPS